MNDVAYVNQRDESQSPVTDPHTAIDSDRLLVDFADALRAKMDWLIALSRLCGTTPQGTQGPEQSELHSPTNHTDMPIRGNRNG